MTVGIAPADANAQLEVYRGTAMPGVTLYAKLHTGDPGAAGTANASVVTTRNAVTFSAASAGSMAMSALADYAMTGAETITHISLWDNATAGTFRRSGQLTVAKTVAAGDLLRFTALTLAKGPLAA